MCVSGCVKEGEQLIVSGPSGSGKTTLLRILARLRAAEGSAFLSGKSWEHFAPVAWRQKIHYLSQKPAIFDGTVRDNLVKPFELAAVRNKLSLDWDLAKDIMKQIFLPATILDQDARTLSGGEASRVALTRALLVDPAVLLMDEPLAALDSKSSAAVVELISAWRSNTEGRGVILVSHVGDFNHLNGISNLTLVKTEGDVNE